ncbi:hypothetical protein DFQ09_1331 [Winogradskyella pacifica]|uniref:Uncharacterized protein n=1 Tax=Winogradskyella pacifica TaxID=664642 RepID=A0A3D9LI35_9FLAO|nr:hypothetical protein [Winogradskyella pacifica]REE06915.1 hypothetical protein DFQ09_1331 [Winogradskyella pacifica]
MRKSFYILTIFLLTINVQAQNENAEFIGTYGDMILANGEFGGTELELKADGTFRLRTTDYVYPQTFKDYTNEGKWVLKDREVILNPHLQRRKPIVNITEKQIGLKDSIEIKFNHYIELYENQNLIEKQKKEFELLTLYFNKRIKYKHLTREWLKEGSCAWAPRIRNRVNLDSTNTFRIAKKDIEKIGIYTYGFTDFIELKTENKNSDYYEIDVVIPIDKERMPRNKKVIIKGNRAYFYEIKGKVKKSLNHLWKKTA